MATPSAGRTARPQGCAPWPRAALWALGASAPALPASPRGGAEVRKYLLDTNIISELRKPKPHGGVVVWINGLQEEQLFLSVVTLGELQAGIERTRRQAPEKARAIELWVDQLAESFQILSMDTRCFREWARLM